MISEKLTLQPSVLATLTVLGLTAYVLQDFLLPMLWAGILAIATWPLYLPLHRRFGPARAGALMTLLVALCIVVPVVWLSNIAIGELGGVIAWVRKISHQGFAYPQMLDKLPAAESVRAWWEQNLARPNDLSDWLEELLGRKLYEVSHVVQVSGVWVLRRIATLFFCLIALFFFFRDGLTLTADIESFCRHRLGERWVASLRRVPLAIRATVDGIVLVGAIIGLLVGLGYAVAGLGSPVLLGILTALAAMIPLAAPLVYGLVAVYLGIAGEPVKGLLLFAWGQIVFWIFDHAVRPIIIGNTARMPFLLVLFGILGGVETMGVIGLFIGPVVMVTFLTWWQTELTPEPSPSQ